MIGVEDRGALYVDVAATYRGAGAHAPYGLLMAHGGGPVWAGAWRLLQALA
ncbi:hypothetical protein [Massilia cavernae]|uniref:hypothetical protein n=1 Tax=Massilia cavernae TaxID=2320864 RepID=UPI0016031FFA|nr:hypothetical protein [Massilia cavernae]